MNQAASPTDIAALGTIMSVWAHPDDESFTAAGIMATATKNGQKVICVTATRGEQGTAHTDLPSERLGDVRQKELAAALDILGVKSHHQLGFPDGGCKDVEPAVAVAQLKNLINQYQPDTILTFGPDGLTGHDDHRTVSAWVGEATKGSNMAVYHAVMLRDHYTKMAKLDQEFNLFFNISQPPLVDEADCALLLRLDGGLLDQKYRCLSAMPSQYGKMFSNFSQAEVGDMLCYETFVRA